MRYKTVYVIFYKYEGKRSNVKCVVTTYKQAEEYIKQGYESISALLESGHIK